MGIISNKISAIFYLYRKTFKNRLKKALKKPVTYIYFVFIALYIYMVFGSFPVFFDLIEINNASFLAAILTVIVFILIPSNLISYSKRKGLVFREPDIHFLFSSPISPKILLLYSHLKNVGIMFILYLIVAIGGVLWLDMPVWKMTVYFLFSFVMENALEASMMILCYGNEKLDKKQMFIVQLFMYFLIGVFVAIGIGVYMREGASFRGVANYLHSPVIQMVPVIGWNIAFLHLLFMGPETINVICSILYFISVIVLFVMALRMKCTGDYFEDAIKFAEDYETAKKKGKAGEVAFVGWKKKYGKASVSYKGKYARAIFYRQLLEYKKNRFFIFGFYTLVCLCLGIGLAVLSYNDSFSGYIPFVILGVMAYLTFIFSGYPGKWGKELKKPYTYLIPDTSLCKLWYATLMEHIRSLIDGCLITLPSGIVLGLPVLHIFLIIVAYVCLQACKLYAEVMVEAFLGNILGNTGKQYARILFEGIVIGMGITGAAIGSLISLETGLFVLIGVVAFLTAGMMAIATINFEKMETVD